MNSPESVRQFPGSHVYYEALQPMSDKVDLHPTEHVNMARLVDHCIKGRFPIIDLGALLQAQADEWEEEQLLDDVVNLFQAPLDEIEETAMHADVQAMFSEAAPATEVAQPQTQAVEVAQPVESQPQAPAAEVAQPAAPQVIPQRLDSMTRGRPARAARPPVNYRALHERKVTAMNIAEAAKVEAALAPATEVPVAEVPKAGPKRSNGIANRAAALGNGIRIQLPGQGMPVRKTTVVPSSCNVEANQTNPNHPQTPPLGRVG